MTLSQLRALLMVLETGSFSAAALELGGAQSAVSYAVAELERELGVKLLERGRFGARPTPVGEQIAGHARGMLSLDAAIRQEANLERGVLRGVLRIATFRSVASHILPKAIAKLGKNYPELHVQLLEADGDTPELERLLASGRADIAFLQAPYPKGALVWDVLRDPYIALLPLGHPLAGGSVSRADLRGLPLIVYDNDDRCAVAAQHYLRDAALPLPPATYSVREDSTIFSLVEQGLGVSIVPELAFRDLPNSVVRAPLSEPLGRTIGVAIAPQNLKVPAVRAFLSVLKKQFPGSELPELGTFPGSVKPRAPKRHAFETMAEPQLDF